MLTKVSIESARELAELLRTRGEKLTVREDTPLEQLTMTTTDAVTPKDQLELPEVAVESLHANSLTLDETETVGHDVVNENVASRMAALANRRLHLLRNVILPVVSKHGDYVIEQLADMVPVTPKIHPIGVKALLSYPQFNQFFTGFQDDNTESVISLGFTVDANLDEIIRQREIAKTGIEEVDQCLNYILDCDEAHAIAYIQTLFDQSEPLTTLFVPRQAEEYPLYLSNIHANIVAFFVVKQLLDASERGNYTVSEETYRERLTSVLARLSTNINGAVQFFGELERQGVVVLGKKVNTHGHLTQVYVLDVNYEKYLAEGGNDAVVVGGAFVNMNELYVTLSSLQEHHDEYIQVNETKMNEAIQRVRQDSLGIAKEKTRQVLYVLAGAIPEEVTNTIPALHVDGSDPVDVMVQRATDYLSYQAITDLNDIHTFVERVITAGMLHELELDKFIYKMSQYTKPQVGVPQLTPAQAAYYVVLDEMVEFMLSQTEVRPIGE